MALKGSYSTLLLSLVLLGAWLALATGRLPNPAKDQFLRRHWDNPKTQATNNTAYCRLLTRCRGIYRRNNTFIHAPTDAINSVCTNGGRPISGNRRRSIRLFRLTICKFNPNARNYTGKSLFRRIVIICRNRFPVRLVRPIRFRPWL
ncbi:hypothetical protein G0U57_009756 [Chelydra serpentina]|uniref:Ribonuclease A-domain domain-containing protein n=1 Tax=Chelydra serpentina TaxID=8475 RepID=A0A8T1RY14_CHESE|nr:hypothetical protein G0U57_009756 [Chelydra serpentina]